ncbi:hypothetical protein M408DRAFT_325354 [Serendipita vermifera MAFF 305830]|uniref:Fatty acid hydroxylase domain-containing protein n=1 Tax=Serendipita vermifera MAFF 305830 TaxID=933852 RepID=A0A0C2XY11_SERVB|nr:hypothetical protein M408DRAFT_325354 [Serendipita vermifera MAFF 305830]
MLEEYLVGRLGKDTVTVSEDWVADEDFHPDDTNLDEDYLQTEFLDLRKPLLRQVWEGNFSKNFYLQQVHQPRHLAYSARLFGPGYLEVFTKTQWYVVPIIWLPIAMYLFLRSARQFTAPLPPVTLETFSSSFPTLQDLQSVSKEAWSLSFASFLLGNLVWTLLEYGFHRFLFHVDRLLPDRSAFITLHFLMHGIHHYLPMDKLRLVMPPIMFFALSFPMTRLAYLLFPVSMANGIIAGAFTFYVLYDCMHYALHHSKLPQYMKEMKKYHLAHHYKNFDLGFGVTSKIWDYVFGTVLPV